MNPPPNSRLIPSVTPRNQFSRSFLQLIVSRLNALLNGTIKRGQSDGVFLGDSNIIYQIANGGGGTGTGTGNVRYLGEYSNAVDYVVNDLVYVDDSYTKGGVTYIVRTPWICLIGNGPASAVHAPTWPEPGTIYWRALARGLDVTEWDVCLADGTQKKALFQSSAAYDP